ncbi:hypothetical protein LCGC14_1517450 [marine sediment metagenome]|uniref:Uncharacterized protein n=1 Tax=marine sediment metagenome TaxID=412755 RepID=A0A0F9M0T0_9ZZZZ
MIVSDLILALTIGAILLDRPTLPKARGATREAPTPTLQGRFTRMTPEFPSGFD